MGRWTFPEGGGEPIYIPDPGEGSGSYLGHLATGAARTLEDVMGSAPVSRFTSALGIPFRSVTAAGYALADRDTKTDPLHYALTGEKLDEEEMASYGELLGDVMAAEGTIDEGGIAQKAVRAAGDLIQDPLVLLGVARASTKLAGSTPPPRRLSRNLRPLRTEPLTDVTSAAGRRVRVAPPEPGGPTMRAPGPAGGTPTRFNVPDQPPGVRVRGGPSPRLKPKKKTTKYRQPPAERPSEASQWPSVPLDPDLASPGVFTPGGVGRLPATVSRRVPPSAARPLDTDLAFGRGGVRRLPGAARAEAAQRRRLRGPVQRMRQEQLGEGVEAMRQEQLAEGLQAMAAEQRALPLPRAAIREMLQAAVEQGASADDIMNLLAQLGG